MSLRKRLEKSETLAGVLGTLAGWYLTFCYRTTTWKDDGLEDIEAALGEGPVLLVLWHSRLMMVGYHWPVHHGTMSSLHDTSPIGRVTGAMLRRNGLLPIKMSRKKSNLAASRSVLKQAKAGVSIGITGDGPLGPALILKDAPLDWARTTGIPIFCYAFSTTKGRRLQSWDQMLVPKPFGKGAYVFRRLNYTISRKASEAEITALRTAVQDSLTEVTHQADALAGLPPGP
ncbi:hypothetical protein BC777_3416 [Yoonia maricola]|uniref:DUF374 domain-containing protein n=1 Tax=Yoonia maricola TaxID=420999 RepID=A0A2M8W3A9_9RHOB|nr:DUF374 domain-containing protein [Yoonia maricola]PJI85413.1 hypothetical protein BC777_3416 [Yoonia maricola]